MRRIPYASASGMVVSVIFLVLVLALIGALVIEPSNGLTWLMIGWFGIPMLISAVHRFWKNR